MQIRQPGRTQWDVIYGRLEMREHVTVVRPLEALIHKFIEENKNGSPPRNPVQQKVPEASTKGASDQSGKPRPPWDS